MGEYNYSTPYQGQRVAPLPEGFMAAATAPGRYMMEAGEVLGAGIGEAIGAYLKNKAEGQTADAEIEAMLAPMLQQQGPTPSGMPVGMHEVVGIIGEKNAKKLIEGKASTADKLGIANALRTYQNMRSQRAQADVMEATAARTQHEEQQRVLAERALSEYQAPSPTVGVQTQYDVQVGPQQLQSQLESLYEYGGSPVQVSNADLARYGQHQAQKVTAAPPGTIDLPPLSAPIDLSGLRRRARPSDPPPPAPVRQPTAPAPEPTFTQTMTGTAQVARPEQEMDADFVNFMRDRGVTDLGVLQQMHALRNFGRGVEVREVDGVKLLFNNGQLVKSIDNPITPELSLKLRTMSVDVPATDALPGLRGMAQSEAEAVKIREGYEETAKLVNAVDEILNIQRTQGFGSALSPATRAKIKTLLGGVVGAARLPFLGPGVMTDSEREWLSSLIGDPTNITSQFLQTVVPRLETFRSNAMANLSNRAHVQGVQLVGGQGQAASQPQSANYVNDPRLK